MKDIRIVSDVYTFNLIKIFTLAFEVIAYFEDFFFG